MSKKKEKEGALRVIDSLNDLFSMISDVSNDEGYNIPDGHMSALEDLHRELLNTVTGK
ncbi:hypothetical protein [Acinetobacter sp.]|uniref:hypothetical protein n=1 Tax=Acinetobacter sp. TaxID=472 RepID=UPI00388F1E5F